MDTAARVRHAHEHSHVVGYGDHDGTHSHEHAHGYVHRHHHPGLIHGDTNEHPYTNPHADKRCDCGSTNCAAKQLI